jgi:5-methyltetrahydrofolate--homocysteine methyltransferase
MFFVALPVSSGAAPAASRGVPGLRYNFAQPPNGDPIMKLPLLEAIVSRPLIGDGAMGTQLMLSGLEQGQCGEAWNLTQPDKVLGIQKRYVQAGADCLITNTFGGCRITLDRHDQGDKVKEINFAGAGLARQAFAAAGREGYVLGDIGPFGGLLEPYGDSKPQAVRDAFAQQAQSLVEAGVDAIIIETQTSLEELGLAIEASRQAGAGCIIGSMAFDVGPEGETFATMMGVDPETAAAFMEEKGVHIVALNCGAGMDMQHALRAVERYKAVTKLPLMAQPNAGQPKLVDGKITYDQTPQAMVAGVISLIQAGVNILGACCGSTPEHIAAFRKALDDYRRA